MIVSLKGRLEDITEDSIILDVQGIGYEILVTGAVRQVLPPLKQELHLYTYLHVRDDALVLYGFSSWEERNLFHRIIGIAGIGPKTAVAILSNIGPRDFVRAVQQKQLDVLTGLPGIGKKTGERILLELKDKFKHTAWADEDEDPPPAPGGILEDATEALIALGYNRNEAVRMVRSVRHQLSENYDLQELLKTALAGGSR